MARVQQSKTRARVKKRYMFGSKVYTAQAISLVRWQIQHRTGPRLKAQAQKRGPSCPECRLVTWAVNRARSDAADSRDSRVEWNFANARRNDCKTCCQIVEALSYNASYVMPEDVVGLIDFSTITSTWRIRIREVGAEDGDLDLAYVCLVHEGIQPDASKGIGRSVDTYRINMDLLRGWIKTCNQEHAGLCHTLEDPWAKIELTTNLLFIDVEQRCLVKQYDLCGTSRYVALSYVWGADKDPLQTLQSNVEALSRFGAFDTKEYTPPLTILDSMEIVRLLGLRYLWVDRFCIVQDDKRTVETHLAAMASIYANAHFTIAACDGDAGSGLAGSTEERQREAPYGDIRFNETCRMGFQSPVKYLRGEWEQQTYGTRGWTFQEWSLSRRMLVFHHHTVSWKCVVVCQQENGLEPLPSVVVHHKKGQWDFENGDLWVSWPNIKSYLYHVEKYARRELTDDGDKLKAFAAMMYVQGRSMKGRMLYGIPELFFSDTLLWSPSTYLSSCKRSTDESIPSWSWAAWKGTIRTYLASFATALDTRSPLHAIHFHTITFYLGESSKDARHKQVLKDIHWWKEHTSPLKTDHSNGFLPDVFEYLLYPPLVKYVDAKAMDPIQQYSTHIRFSTQHLHAWVTNESREGHTMSSIRWNDDFLDYYSLIGQGPGSFLCDDEGDVVGCMEIDFRDVAQQYHGRIERVKLDLICISGLEFGWNNKVAFNVPGARYFHIACQSKCYDRRVGCKLGPDWKFRFYNVLWVEWEDGVAYRKGIGKIWAHCWDKLCPQPIDVVLG